MQGDGQTHVELGSHTTGDHIFKRTHIWPGKKRACPGLRAELFSPLPAPPPPPFPSLDLEQMVKPTQTQKCEQYMEPARRPPTQEGTPGCADGPRTCTGHSSAVRGWDSRAASLPLRNYARESGAPQERDDMWGEDL